MKRKRHRDTGAAGEELPRVERGKIFGLRLEREFRPRRFVTSRKKKKKYVSIPRGITRSAGAELLHLILSE